MRVIDADILIEYIKEIERKDLVIGSNYICDVISKTNLLQFIENNSHWYNEVEKAIVLQAEVDKLKFKSGVTDKTLAKVLTLNKELQAENEKLKEKIEQLECECNDLAKGRQGY